MAACFYGLGLTLPAPPTRAPRFCGEFSLRGKTLNVPAARNSRPTLQYALLAIVFAIAGTFFAHHLWYMAELLKNDAYAASDVFSIPLNSARISDVTAEAKAAGLLPGDTVLAINGQPYHGVADKNRVLEYAHPGDLLTLAIERGASVSASHRQTVRFALPGRESKSDLKWVAVALGILLPTSCFLLGFAVAALRPRDPLAWLLLGLMLGFASFLNIGSEFTDGATFSNVASIFKSISQHSWFLWIFLLGIYFPTRIPLDRRFPWIKWLLIVPLALRVVLQTVSYVGLLNDYSFAARLPHSWKVANRMVSIYPVLAAIALFFILIGVKYFTARAPDARRRLRLLYAGAFFSIVPTLALIVAGSFTGKNIDDFPFWIEVPPLLLLLLFPATLAYLIIVHKVMDVRVVIRQGLQYALARRGVKVLQSAITAALAIGITIYISRHHPSALQILAVIAVAVFLRFGLRKLMARLALWIDRRFFREAYNAELLLGELSYDVRNIVETRPLLETVASRISEALHVPQTAVLLHSSGPFQPAYALGYAAPEALSAFPRGGAAQHLLASKSAARVYLDDPNNWVNTEPEVSGEERRGLAHLHSELLLPLVLKDRMLGFISLSQKRSEEAYSGTDLHLLNSVASQTALALENSRLTGEIAQEVAHRERLAQEMEIAREVQEHLLPQSLPAVAGAEIAGSFRPAQGVGGDYYDFLELPNGKLGIAIGDVSGKGVSAALVMANLQASLRSQSLASEAAAAASAAVVGVPAQSRAILAKQEPYASQLAVMVTRINRLIYQSSAASRYATFFFAEFDPRTRVLDYVNAGHNPPLLL
ncbi:MAG: SpoIIE family protein phosphatase, partial [Acidobacteriaceae bacterium]